MKVLLKAHSEQRNNSDVCIVTEYPTIDGMIDFAIVKIRGQYPEKGYAINQICKEMVYVHEGNGMVIVNGIEQLLNAGDIILIEAGEKFCWKGNMDLFISCRPAFQKEQHQILESVE